MKLRRASISDIPTIRSIAYATWPVTYSGILSTDQLHFMLERMYGEGPLSKQLLEQGHQFLMASMAGADIGFAAYEQGVEGRPVARIHKLYVLPGHHRSGAGRLLVERIMDECRNAGLDAVELNVNRHNTAMHFYVRLGFKVIRSEVIPIGNGYVMDDHVMSIDLVG